MFLLSVILSVTSIAASEKTYINNTLFNNITYYNSEGMLMIYGEEVSKGLQSSFTYDSKTMKAKIVNKIKMIEIELRLDSDIACVNGQNLKMCAPMQIHNFRVSIPVDFITKELDAKLYYSSKHNAYFMNQSVDGKVYYKVLSGDTLWYISQAFGNSIDYIIKANNLSSNMIYVGQKLVVDSFNTEKTVINAQTKSNATIFSQMSLNSSAVGYLKAWNNIAITGKNDSYYSAQTSKGNGYLHTSVVYIPQIVTDKNPDSNYYNSIIKVNTDDNYIKYQEYTIKSGDNIWLISNKYGVTVNDILKANGLNYNSVLYIGQVIKVPIRVIAREPLVTPESGEILDWFIEGQYVLPIDKKVKVTDLYTGKSFYMIRTIGANHADCETASYNDTLIMKQIFGGYWSWRKRPFILEVDDREFAVSIAGMPHAGLDSSPYLANVSNRSDDWGYGPNYDKIKGNGMDGHFDMYFLNSRTHNTNSIDGTHQKNVLISGGLH